MADEYKEKERCLDKTLEKFHPVYNVGILLLFNPVYNYVPSNKNRGGYIWKDWDGRSS